MSDDRLDVEHGHRSDGDRHPSARVDPEVHHRHDHAEHAWEAHGHGHDGPAEPLARAHGDDAPLDTEERDRGPETAAVHIHTGQHASASRDVAVPAGGAAPHEHRDWDPPRRRRRRRRRRGPFHFHHRFFRHGFPPHFLLWWLL